MEYYNNLKILFHCVSPNKFLQYNDSLDILLYQRENN